MMLGGCFGPDFCSSSVHGVWSGSGRSGMNRAAGLFQAVRLQVASVGAWPWGLVYVCIYLHLMFLRSGPYVQR